MQVLKLLKFFILPILVLSAVHCDFLEKSFEKLAKFSCEVVDALFRDQPETKTIAILYWNSKFEKTSYELIMKCLSRDVAVVILDPNLLFTYFFVNPSLIILVSDWINWVIFLSFVVSNFLIFQFI